MCPNIWDLTKTEASIKEFVINPKYLGTVKIRIDRPRSRLSENSIPFVLVIGPFKIVDWLSNTAGFKLKEIACQTQQDNVQCAF